MNREEKIITLQKQLDLKSGVELARVRKSAKPRKQNASKLITNKKSFAMKKDNAKRITVSTWDGTGRYGYSNKYIANTKANKEKIIALKGKPELHNGKYIWM